MAILRGEALIVPAIRAAKGLHEVWHVWNEIGQPARNIDVGKLRMRLLRQRRADARAQDIGRLCRPHALEQGDAAFGLNHAPAGRDRKLVGRNAGLLGDLPAHAAFEVDGVAAHVIEVGRTARKIDITGIDCPCPHDAEQKGIVSPLQRAERKAVLHRAVRETPVAPSDKARKVRLQIGAMQGAFRDPVFVEQQNRPVPQTGLLAPKRREIYRDLPAVAFRERPWPRRQTKRQTVDRNYR
ncbi:MAG: hypothetical protein M5U33_05100 [Pseudorhodoplanes sp.]|nr:hypothetical protein [Pseudorhodoplanes sp.]